MKAPNTPSVRARIEPLDRRRELSQRASVGIAKLQHELRIVLIGGLAYSLDVGCVELFVGMTELGEIAVEQCAAPRDKPVLGLVIKLHGLGSASTAPTTSVRVRNHLRRALARAVRMSNGSCPEGRLIVEHNEVIQPERRHAPRIEAVGTAIVHGELPALRARIVDISAGGMLVQIGRLTGLEPWLDRAVAVDIRVDGHLRRWLTAIGRIRRLDVNTGLMAVHFDTVPTELQDLLAVETIASNDRDRQPHVILIHKIAEVRDGIARSFREAGCSVIEVSSTLDALVQLGKSRYAPELIVLGETMPEHLAEELRDFLMDEHPGARVVAMDAALDSIDAKVLRLIEQALS